MNINHIKNHLYETNHSGFYGEDISATVNLLPKPWTNYTVTDGNWKTKNTLEPLWNRDIYLANKIDEIRYDKENHYKGEGYFVIDNDNKIFYLNIDPIIEQNTYNFNLGLIKKNFSVSLKLKDEENNKLYLNINGLDYNYTPGISTAYLDPNVIYTSAAPSSNYSIKINNNDVIEEYNDLEFQNNKIIFVNSALFESTNDTESGAWFHSMVDYWDYETSTRIQDGKIPGYEDFGTTAWEHIENYNTSSSNNDCFNPLDKRPSHYENKKFEGGSNFISGTVNMLPDNVLYIW